MTTHDAAFLRSGLFDKASDTKNYLAQDVRRDSQATSHTVTVNDVTTTVVMRDSQNFL